jgi:hypothetical protein
MRKDIAAGKATLGAIVEFLAQDVVAGHLLCVDRGYFPIFASSAAT